MRRSGLTSLGVLTCGLILATGLTPAGGTASAACPEPTTASTTTAPATSPSKSSPTAVPVALTSAKPTTSAQAAATSSGGAGALATTGAPLLLELLIGAAALIMGLAISRFSRRQDRNRKLARTQLQE